MATTLKATILAVLDRVAAWLATHGRILLTVPIESCWDGLSQQVQTLAVTPPAAALAAALGDPFPGDPADRLIFGTAAHRGWSLVTTDRRLRSVSFARDVTIW